MPTIIRLQPEQTLPLRQRLLRPQQTVEECRFAGDDAPDTRHYGAMCDAALCGIVSIYRHSHPQLAGEPSWQIRAMATLPERRLLGLGRALLEEAIRYAASQGAATIWCNAREVAVPFYQRCGFAIQGERFVIEGIGPHYLMHHATNQV